MNKENEEKTFKINKKKCFSFATFLFSECFGFFFKTKNMIQGYIFISPSKHKSIKLSMQKAGRLVIECGFKIRIFLLAIWGCPLMTSYSRGVFSRA